MKLDLFFATHTVFTFKELKASLGSAYKNNSTLQNLLQYHQKQGHILLIRKGLYAAIPKESQGFENLIDPFLLAGKLSDDAVLAYHTALALDGKTYTVTNCFYYLTRTRKKKNFEFQGNSYQAVSSPSKLKKTDLGVVRLNRQGLVIAVTSLERTFVDILDRPYLCLFWEEIFRAIESIEYLHLDAVLEYASHIRKQKTAAIVGFFLELNQEKWMVSTKILKALQKLSPKKPFYLHRSLKGPYQLISKWNLIIPVALLNKSWEEPHADI
jgi:predicted transcriptional regulator of viral defense system